MRNKKAIFALLGAATFFAAFGFAACDGADDGAGDGNHMPMLVAPVAITLSPENVQVAANSEFSLTLTYDWGDFDPYGVMDVQNGPQPDWNFSWESQPFGFIEYQSSEPLNDTSDTVWLRVGDYDGELLLTATSASNPQCSASVTVQVRGNGGGGGGEYTPCAEENLDLQLVGDHYVVTGLGSYQLGSVDMGTFYDQPNALIIINQPNGIPITEVAEGAFAGNTQITHFESSTVTTVGDGAFENCTALQKIYLQETTGAVAIGDAAFKGCDNLEEALLPRMKSVGEYAFAGLTKLDFVGGIGLSLQYEPNATVGAHAFDGCTALTYLQGGADDLIVGEYAFANCSGISSVHFLAEELGSYALSGCTSIGGVDLSLKTVGRYSFAGCDNLQRITFTEKVDSIAAYAFENAARLSSVQWQKGVDTIYEAAFKGCQNLASVQSDGSIDCVGDEAFSGCVKMYEFVVSGSVRLVSSKAFRNAGTNVTAMYDRKYLSYDVSEGTKIFRSEAFENAALQKIDLTKCETIEANVFSYCGGEVENVRLPASYTTVPDSVFKNFTGMKSFIFNEGTTEIGDYAFCNTGLIGTLTLQPTIASIGANAFWSTDLTAVKAAAPAVVETEYVSFQIGDLAFAHCTSLQDFDLSAWDTRTTLSKAFGDYVFTECTTLKTVYLGNTYSIGYGAFKGVSTLTAFTAAPKLATQTAVMFILAPKTAGAVSLAIDREDLANTEQMLARLNSNELDDYKWTSK